MSQQDLVELVADLQSQLSKRGAAAFRTLEIAFEVNDHDRNGLFDFQEIEAVLAKAGLFLKRQSLTQLYRYFDHGRNERVHFPEVLAAIRGPLSPRRANILHQVFDALDTNHHGAVDCQRIVCTFNPSRHPQVLSGEKKAAALEREFASAFDGAGATNNGAVSRDEFIHFYNGISAATPYDDDFFISVVERCWGVQESIPSSLVPGLVDRSSTKSATLAPSRTPLMQRVQQIFREKIRQKTFNTKSELENLRLVLKHFDLSGTCTLDLTSFTRALERFGICLDQRTLQALFAEFENEDGRLDYLAFATAVYSEDTTSAAFHQLQRSQSLKATQRLAAEAARPDTRREYLDAAHVLVSSPIANGRLSASQQLPQSKSATVRRTLTQLERENSVLPTVVFLFGGPGVGKLTQSSRVVREFGFVHLSVPALLRAEQANKSSVVGKQIAAASAAGARVSPAVCVGLLQQSIAEHVNSGSLYFIVDGFPSTLEERAAWERASAGKLEVPWVLYFEAAQSTLESRLQARATHTGAPLNPAQVKQQLGVFARDTIQVVNSYGQEGRLQVVDASGTPDAVYAQVQQLIASL